MKRLTVEEIRLAVKGRWRGRRGRVSVAAVCTDSRRACTDGLFVALRGENYDGHDFLAAAASAGCVAALVREDSRLDPDALEGFGGGVIGVGDTRGALGDLAGHYRRRLAATVVAVTGSNGKTTVKSMIHHILSTRMKGCVAPMSYNNDVGVPRTILGAGADDEYVICEVGTSAPGQIAGLGRLIQPDVAVITSVAMAHLEGLGDLERVAVEKASLLADLSPDGVAVVCADSQPLRRALGDYDARLIRFGRDDSADLRLTGYEPTHGGGRFELNGRIRADLAVPGRHNAMNALAAIAVAQRFGIDQDEAAAALSDYEGVDMRLEPIRAGAVTIINDAYNSNPSSLLAGAQAMASFPGQRRVLVAGDMLELGPDSQRLHYRAGRALAGAGVDLLVGVGSLGRRIASGAASEGVCVEEIESVSMACKTLPPMLSPGDVVLLKGSRLMAMERLTEPIRAAFEQTAGPGKTARKRRGRK